MDIQQSNRLIAEFENRLFYGSPISKFGEGTCNALPEMYYHSSWEWLMPVVKKIQQLEIEEFSKKKPVMAALTDVDIDSLYNAVVIFIQWYNENKQ